MVLLIVFNQFQALIAIEWKLFVVRDEGDSVGDGVGYDHVVGGVVVGVNEIPHTLAWNLSSLPI